MWGRIQYPPLFSLSAPNFCAKRTKTTLNFLHSQYVGYHNAAPIRGGAIFCVFVFTRPGRTDFSAKIALAISNNTKYNWGHGGGKWSHTQETNNKSGEGGDTDGRNIYSHS